MLTQFIFVVHLSTFFVAVEACDTITPSLFISRLSFCCCLVGDFDKIWREHCEDEETLCEYAEAMKNLADNHWTKTCEGEGRIEWCCR